MKVHFELTDTFGGQANYCWVRRVQLVLPPDTGDDTLIKLAREWAGWGVRSEREDMGDVITLRPRRLCQVLFITFPEADAPAPQQAVRDQLRALLDFARTYGPGGRTSHVDWAEYFAESERVLNLPFDELTESDVVSWADGIVAALGTEYANRVTEREAQLADAILKVARPANYDDGRVRARLAHTTGVA